MLLENRKYVESAGSASSTSSKNTRSKRTRASALVTAVLSLSVLAVGFTSPASAGEIPQEPVSVQAPEYQPMGAPDYSRTQDNAWDYVTSSPQATDMTGVQKSAYTGDFYRSGMESTRMCIVRRESEGQYRVRGGGGNNYFGAYQMSPELARGATWMMLKEHRELLGSDRAEQVLTKLRNTPANEWNRYWQDAAFYTIANWDYPGSGLQHWAGGRWSC